MENFRGRKLSQIGEKYDFHGENFRGLLAFATPKDATPQISWRKLLHIAINHEICESFLLYDESLPKLAIAARLYLQQGFLHAVL